MADKVFVINMDKDTDRLYQFEKEMKKLSVKYERFKALSHEDRDKYSQYIHNDISVKNSEMGCLLSHLAIYEKLLQDTNSERYLIFEDDARTHYSSNLSALIEDFYSKISNYESVHTNGYKEPDVLYLGRAMDKCCKMLHIFGNYYKTVSPFCCHAYVINKSFAKKVLSIKHRDPIDLTLSRLIEENKLTAVTIHPNLFYQDVFLSDSNLRPKREAFYNNQECSETSNLNQNEEQKNLYTTLLLFLIILMLVILIMVHYNYSK